jgi:nucleotide-binding universal stress UspA family protein
MRVLVGVDDSRFSEAAVRWVAGAAWPEKSRFIVLSSAEPLLIGTGEAMATETITAWVQQQDEDRRRVADRAAEKLRRVGLTVDARLARGDPRFALEEAARAERVDLIVVGSHGRTGIKKLLIGSVACHLVTHAPCSVLVVKSPTSPGRGT